MLGLGTSHPLVIHRVDALGIGLKGFRNLKDRQANIGGNIFQLLRSIRGKIS